MSVTETYDVFVVGGGINGIGIGVDAAGRGLKVGLCEMGDLAGATSSASSKLIHGGLRYLENYEFRLVRESLAEREVLLNMAPHIAWPMRFCLPHRPQLRPAWMIRAGLFLYDYLSVRSTLPGCKSVDFNETTPLKPDFVKGFEYSDAWVDDARLVILNAMGLRERGGHVFTRTRAVSGRREDGVWTIGLVDQISGAEWKVQARALVNAAGPWVTEFIQNDLQQKASRNVRLIKGSHIILPRIHQEDRSYILQNDDKRIVFVIPWLDQFSLVGTTDVEYQGDPNSVACSDEEKDYLCRVVNEHFVQQVSVDDIIWEYSGVRPLCEDESSDPSVVTRDYTFEVDDEWGKAPLFSVFGGKLTTYRKLAEHAMNQLVRYFPEAGSAWTTSSKLPGAQPFDECYDQLTARYPWLPIEIRERFCRCYGSLSFRLLGQSNALEDLGIHFGGGLYQVEVDYLISHEWALSVEDIIWRRSKLGIYLDSAAQKTLEVYLDDNLPRLFPERFEKKVA